MKYKQTSDVYFIRQLTLIISLFIFGSLLQVQSVYAASMSKLYESAIQVDADGTEVEKAEKQLIEEAFTHVLIKVSGRSDVTASPAYDDMLKKADGAISQFRYDYRDRAPVTDEASASNETDKTNEQKKDKEKWFWVRFNAKTVNDLLNQAQIPIWGKIRPESLIWFSQETQGKRDLQSQYDEPEIYAVFKKQADQRGIALTFPFLDLQDQSSVSAADIWGNFNDAILLASRRYQAQSTLTVRLFKEPSGLWVSQWSLLMLGEVQPWELRGEELDSVLASGIDELADKLSRQFTQVVTTDNDSGLLVQINNVDGYKAFQELDDYLLNLATVKSIVIKRVEQDKVIYSINYLSSKNSFIQEIRLGDLLKSVERSRVQDDQYNNDNNSAYKPVILSEPEANSAQGKSISQMSDREKALQTQKAGVPNAPQMVPEKIVEQLIPDLEFWLAR